MRYRPLASIRALSASLVLSGCLCACATAPSDRNTAGGGEPERQHNKLDLKLCKTSVSNPPEADGHAVVRGSALACAQGVELLVAPAPKACLTSGFGTRGGHRHAGLDYQSKPAGPVVAAAAGTVASVKFRQKDFGHWIVIDHGQGVYTGYAHLASVLPGIVTGARVTRGQSLGIMGSTGNATRAVHLHVEYRIGDLSNRRGWWGLVPVNPFALPERCT